MANLRIAFTSQSGQPLPFVQVKVVSATTGQDRTATLFGVSPVVANANGIVEAEITTNSVPSGLYNVIGSTPGYRIGSFETPENFTGTGVFTFALEGLDLDPEDPESDYEVTVPFSVFVSPMQPVSFILTKPSALSDRQQDLLTTVAPDNGQAVPFETPFEGGTAYADVQSCLGLDPRFILVPDVTFAAEESNFSGKASVQFDIITDSGIELSPIPTFDLLYANIYPPGNINDLSVYTDSNGLARWISPWPGEVPVFRGYYFDVLIWIQPGEEGGDEYVLKLSEMGINKNPLQSGEQPLPEAAFLSGRTQAIRPPAPTNVDTVYIDMWIERNGEPITETLTLRYL